MKPFAVMLVLYTGFLAGGSKTIPVGKGPDALFLTPDERFLYVANVEDTFISVIDSRTDKVVTTIDGTDYPWGFARLGETNLVAVSGWDKGIDVIDFTRHWIVRAERYQLNLGGLVASRDGRTLYVVATDANKVLKVDAESLEIQDAYPTGNGSDGVGLSKSGDKLYVTNTKDGTISIIDVKTKEARLLEVGGKPELIHADHDRSRLFISNFLADKVHVLNTESDEIVHEITSLDGPQEAVLSKDGKTLFVVNFNNSKVYLYDGCTYRKRPEEYSVGRKPIGIVTAANDTKLYVSNYGDNTVSAIAVRTSARAARDSGGEVLVKFRPGTKAEQIEKLAAELGLEPIKEIAPLRIRVFRITSDRTLKDVLAACQKQPFVEYAEPNQKVGAQK